MPYAQLCPDAPPARKLAKMEGDFDKTFTAHSPQSMLGPETLKSLSPEELESLTAHFNRIKGRQGEVYLKTVLDKAGLTRPMGDEPFLRRYEVDPGGGAEKMVRHFDEVVEERTQAFLKVFHIKRKDTGQGTAIELKTDNSPLSKNQKEFAAAQKTESPEASPSRAAVAAGKTLPADIGDEAKNLRIALTDLPKDQLVDALRTSLKEGKRKYSDAQIDAVLESVEDTYALASAAKQQGNMKIASSITLGVLLSGVAAQTLMTELGDETS